MSDPFVYASVLFRPHDTNRSILAEVNTITADNVRAFDPRAVDQDATEKRLHGFGFETVARTRVGLTFRGPRPLFESTFGKLVLSSVKSAGLAAAKRYRVAGANLSMDALGSVVEGVQLAVPGVPFAGPLPTAASAASVPPIYSLNVRTDVPALLNALPVHAAGNTGAGIRVSMVDTGFIIRVEDVRTSTTATQVSVGAAIRTVVGVWLGGDVNHTGTNYFTGGTFAGSTITLGSALPGPTTPVRVAYSCIHPHYASAGYTFGTIEAVAGLDLERDELGHGTAEAANVLALAPGCTFSFVKYSNGASLNFPLAGFQLAVAQNPHIITCSWGTLGADPALHLEVADAVAAGIVTVFAAGNGHTDAGGIKPVAHPNALLVGGTYPIEGGGFRASNYASSYASVIYTTPQREVPDIAGLVGDKPAAALIRLPTEPDNNMDRGGAAIPFPDGDNTTATDGWVVVSGTSAAAPQVAGVCALLLNAQPGLSPRQVKNILQNTALDVTAGTSNSAGPDAAGQGWDRATGFGLVQAQAAVNWLTPGTTDLYLRDFVGDVGLSPSGGGSFYMSPDIIVRQSPPTDAPTELGITVKHRNDLGDKPEDGQNNGIYLRVQNRGAVAGAATATVYFTPPGMFHNPASWTVIGTLPIPSVAPGDFTVAGPLVWTDALIPGTGHYCLVAILHSAADPAPNLAAVTSEAQFVQMVRDRNNVAWKNVEIEDVVSGSSAGFSFFLEAPRGASRQARLELDLSQFLPDSQVLVRVARSTAATATLTGLRPLEPGGDHQYWAMTARRGVVEGLTLRPGTRYKVQVQYGVPAKAVAGDWLAHVRYAIDGQNMGAYSHIARVSPGGFVGNRSSLEVHRPSCPWVGHMSAHNRRGLADLAEAGRLGYDNCAICIGDSRR